ncbi:uncharacterized protein FOBCDRAFT_232992 [Fusarium oxysporum Fo47]|uniref:uncharacterized protein n=1 Tax=Fusarium oxysporum Fo47 TaxID=660027 RepID=UPI0028698FDC|nr:uncharacterized protein FOBCDRAFT_232992 [Fusarium oxysporum Fo47]WJG37043.1 hypothetical protein FOBCDRAFT_232992 [Fusarium oxysporum Fo47]
MDTIYVYINFLFSRFTASIVTIVYCGWRVRALAIWIIPWLFTRVVGLRLCSFNKK